jgi:hypothetical protein
VAAACRRDLGTCAGAVTLGASVDGVVDGAALGSVGAGATRDAGAVAVEEDGAVAGGTVAGAGATVSVGSGDTAGGVVAGGVVAVAWVEIAARPANTPTPAMPPAAIHRVAIVVRAIPRSRSRSGWGFRGGWVRFGGSRGWDGIDILPISVVVRFARPGKRTAATR